MSKDVNASPSEKGSQDKEASEKSGGEKNRIKTMEGLVGLATAVLVLAGTALGLSKSQSPSIPEPSPTPFITGTKPEGTIAAPITPPTPVAEQQPSAARFALERIALACDTDALLAFVHVHGKKCLEWELPHNRRVVHCATYLSVCDPNKRERFVRALLEFKPNLNVKNGNGQTPLHLAAHGWDTGTLRLVRLYVGHGASLETLNEQRRTPVDEARASGHLTTADEMEHLRQAKKSMAFVNERL